MKKGSLFGILVLGLLWTALVGTFDSLILYKQFRQIRATTFPQTTGTVTHSGVTRGGGRTTTYHVQILYTYQVNGQPFHGNRYDYGDSNNSFSSDSQRAHTVVQDFPAGASVPVFYNPKNPADALLHPGIDGGDVFILFFLMPLNILMLWLWAVGLVPALRTKFRQPVAGGVKWIDDGRLIRVRLPRYSPLALCGATIGIGSIISFFMLGGTAGFHPSMRSVLTTWAIVLGGGVVVAAWAYAKASRGNFDLVIDQTARKLELPATFGRKQRRTVSCSAFSGIRVETITLRGGKGPTSYTYAVILELTGGDEQLTDWHDGNRANSLADWLCECIRHHRPATPPPKNQK